MESVQKLLDSNPRNALLIDKRVLDLHFQGLKIDKKRMFSAEATEEFKSLSGGFVPVLDWLADLGLTKSDTLIVVGGGIMQDMGAFAGCVFKRGIPWVFFPTTVLSMCDSCIGGKSGINHGKFKNQIALFSAPRKVVVNPQFLKTLSQDDVASGLGEAMKLHITGGGFFWKRWMQEFQVAPDDTIDTTKLRELIWGSLLIKRAVIERDEFELDLRRSLNYGHTLGHAIESLSGFEIPHGKAVAFGMAIVNRLSVNRKFLDSKLHEELLQTFRRLAGKKAIEILKRLNMQDLVSVLSRDKKNDGSFLNLVLIADFGKTFFLKIQNDAKLTQEIQEAIAEVIGDTKLPYA